LEGTSCLFSGRCGRKAGKWIPKMPKRFAYEKVYSGQSQFAVKVLKAATVN